MNVGCIDFVNSLPIYYAIEQGIIPCSGTLVKGMPVELNRRLLAGELVVSPISSIEFARHASELVLVPGVSISSDSGAHSVILASRVPVAQLRGETIAVSALGATTPVLLQILLSRYFHVDPKLVPFRGTWQEALRAHAAAMIIGDEALACVAQRPPVTLVDLGEAWQRATGQKMVFALWAAPRAIAERDPELIAHLAEALTRSRDWGVAHLDELTREARRRTGLDEPFLKRYFTALQYQLRDAEWSGLRQFWELAASVGALEAVADAAVFDPRPSGYRAR